MSSTSLLDAVRANQIELKKVMVASIKEYVRNAVQQASKTCLRKSVMFTITDVMCSQHDKAGSVSVHGISVPEIMEIMIEVLVGFEIKRSTHDDRWVIVSW